MGPLNKLKVIHVFYIREKVTCKKSKMRKYPGIHLGKQHLSLPTAEYRTE